jgi:hypothetical protein
MEDRETIKAGDVQYFNFYLKERDRNTGSITPYNLNGSGTITFRMKVYGNTVNALTLTMSTVSIPSNTLGYCRVLATVPTILGNYTSEIEVNISPEIKTWEGPKYYIVEQFG